MFAQLRSEIDLVQCIKGQTPERIVVTRRVPRGAIFSAPIGDEKRTLSIRHSKRGPYQILVHPNDWRKVIQVVEAGAGPSSPLAGPRLPVTAWGIPVRYGTGLGGRDAL